MVYDFILFSDELDLLEIRLATLFDVVDKFVITEGNTTFSGRPRELVLEKNMDRFSRFFSKLEYMKVLDVQSPDVWLNERITRNSALAFLHNEDKIAPDDVVMYSDVDELPRAAVVKDYDGNAPMVMHQHFLYYRVNCMASHPQPWPGTTISLGKHLKLSKVQSDVMKSDMFFENLRTQRDTLPSIANAGWHFSYCLPIEQIQSKIRSFSHAQILDTAAINNPEYIQSCIEKGESLNSKGICGDNISIKKVGIDMLDLPPYLLLNQSRFQYLFA